jgi:hypothetical protein
MTHTAIDIRPARSAPRRAAFAQVWPLTAVVGLAVFAAAVITAGVLNQGYNPLSEGIGGLGAQNAVDPDVMKVGFLALAVATAAAGVALFRSLPAKTGVAASIIVILAGVGQTAVAFVRQDCSTAREKCADAEVNNTLSNSHTIHQVVALGAALALVVSLWMIATSLRGSPDTESLARPTMWAAVASTCAFIWLGSQVYGDIGGVVEKLLIALVYGWPVFLAVALMSRSGRRLPRDEETPPTQGVRPGSLARTG